MVIAYLHNASLRFLNGSCILEFHFASSALVSPADCVASTATRSPILTEGKFKFGTGVRQTLPASIFMHGFCGLDTLMICMRDCMHEGTVRIHDKISNT